MLEDIHPYMVNAKTEIQGVSQILRTSESGRDRNLAIWVGQ